MPSEDPVVILGAGLAGLSAAYHLRRPYKIFESENTIGGVARSITIDGFTFDHAIHVLFTNDPYASELIKSLLGDNFIEQSRSSWIFSHGVYTPYPYQAHMFGLPRQLIDENLLGLIEARYSKATSPVSNFEEWTQSTFGSGIAKNFMTPFNRKVWATEPREMSIGWINDRVMLPELHQIFEGAYAETSQAYGPNASFWYPKEGGTAALPNAFAHHVDSVAVGYECKLIDPELKTIVFQNGEVERYRSLISTIPLPKLLEKIEGFPTEIDAQRALLRSNRVITINLGIARENISDKHWVYFPEAEYEFHRVSFPANFSKSLVPAGMSSIMVEISESNSRPIERHQIVERTVDQLERAGILRMDDKIVCKAVVEIDPAYVIYDHAHEEATRTISEYLSKIGILSCGRFGEWKYLNMDQAILSGKCAAEQVNELQQTHVSLSY